MALSAICLNWVAKLPLPSWAALRTEQAVSDLPEKEGIGLMTLEPAWFPIETLGRPEGLAVCVCVWGEGGSSYL